MLTGATFLTFEPTAATMPATSPPGSPGSRPGYMPRTLSTSRKFNPIALTVSKTCTRMKPMTEHHLSILCGSLACQDPLSWTGTLRYRAQPNTKRNYQACVLTEEPGIAAAQHTEECSYSRSQMINTYAAPQTTRVPQMCVDRDTRDASHTSSGANLP